MFIIPNICSKNTIDLLVFLGRRYREEFYVREMARTIGVSAGSASEDLRELHEAGLVTREKKGRLVLYRADMTSPLLREIKVCATLVELNSLVMALRAVATRVVLFGSCATGENTDESDIDLCVESDDRDGVERLVRAVDALQSREFSLILLSPDEFLEVPAAPWRREMSNGPLSRGTMLSSTLSVPLSSGKATGRRVMPVLDMPSRHSSWTRPSCPST